MNEIAVDCHGLGQLDSAPAERASRMDDLLFRDQVRRLWPPTDDWRPSRLGLALITFNHYGVSQSLRCEIKRLDHASVRDFGFVIEAFDVLGRGCLEPSATSSAKIISDSMGEWKASVRRDAGRTPLT